MHPMGEIRKHFWLTLGMAKHCKVDLGVALQRQEITRSDYADMVTACRHCDAPEACSIWLEKAQDSEPASQYCMNRGQFAKLAG